ncbi:SAM-dependent methyltransferase [Microbispora bryophytorum]|uniref:SAM-dependent methyltransferase n=1 Tax=Microbispora bryophytorum TaxID=1460882 RepID=UPI0033D5F2B8
MPALHRNGTTAHSAPVVLDVTKPNVARMYDYYLGGKDNYAADRACAREVIRQAPITRELARANRAFLRRAVRYLAEEAGVSQFLDVGAGLPTQDNVHQVARRVDPSARVVYVDNDPMVLVHARALLAVDAQTRVIQGDVRKPDDILANWDLRGLLDLSRPVGVLLVAVLHFIPDDEHPYEAVRTLLDAMPPGSYLVISHVEHLPHLEAAAAPYERANVPVVLRTFEEIGAFFTGLTVLRPGLVNVRRWRPDDQVLDSDRDVPCFGGVAVKL